MITQPDLSVIIVSCRPNWLANCLHQLRRQKHDLKIDEVVVAEGLFEPFSSVIEFYGVKRSFSRPLGGMNGAFGRDYGISQAMGRYVCFWDDDNIYYDHALESLYAAAKGNDIGICRSRIMGLGFRSVPDPPEIAFGNLDTMCLCVRRSFATRARWADHYACVGTDFAYVSNLLPHGPSINFSDVEIGQHLDLPGKPHDFPRNLGIAEKA